MMLVLKHKIFEKHYKQRIKPNPLLDQKTRKKIELFLIDKTNPELKDHKLTGHMKEFRSFSIAHDLRVIYKETDECILFLDIGSHNQVY
jgi:addiction module RelE/StbE family toxin